MTGKQIVSGFLLVFVIAAVGALVVREQDGSVRTAVNQSPAVVVSAERAVAINGTQQSGARPQQITHQAQPAPGQVKQVGSTVKSSVKESIEKPLDPTVVVYYFHGNTRCYTCKRIEALAQEAVKNSFTEDLESGRVIFQSVNVETPANEHFVNDYQLATRSLVLVRFSGGKQVRWKNLDRVWTLVRDPDAYDRYVADETRQMLAGA